MSTYHLSWTDMITGEISWRIERKTMPSGDYGEIGYALPDHTTYDDDTAPATGQYRYRIRPQYITSYGGYSNEVECPIGASDPATNLRLTGYGIPPQINLVGGVSVSSGGIEWNDITGETEYRIKWGRTAGNRPNTYVLAAGMTNVSLNAFLRFVDFETDETWTGGTADTVTYTEGSQARSLTSTGPTALSYYTPGTPWDLTVYDDFVFDLYISDVTQLDISQTTIHFGDLGGSNYFLSIASTWGTLQNGWNTVRISRADIPVGVGSPNWTSIPTITLFADALAGDTVTLIFDNLRGTGTYFLSVIGWNSYGQVESNELQIVVI